MLQLSRFSSISFIRLWVVAVWRVAGADVTRAVTHHYKSPLAVARYIQPMFDHAWDDPHYLEGATPLVLAVHRLCRGQKSVLDLLIRHIRTLSPEKQRQALVGVGAKK